MVRAFIKAGADVNLSSEKRSPLMLAVYGDHVGVAKFLLDSKADLYQVNDRGSNALEIAFHLDNLNVLKVLIDSKADLNRLTEDGRFLLQIAAYRGHTGVVKMLIDADANVNQQTESGSTALNVAASQGHIGVVELLMEAKADLNKATSDKRKGFPLSSAARWGHVAVVEVLINAGCDLFQKDGEGLTAIQIAMYWERHNVVKVLKEPMSRLTWLPVTIPGYITIAVRDAANSVPYVILGLILRFSLNAILN